ncbi:AI-2E family transporter [Parabacteroides acidifaciens]|uniref:AI-2E family transporter n=1 Tax=Parabacteroides acidifaciens TaxID=2290935 RepID=A0A3D8HJ99_9BACT|nr:AI-2E family transporter [Parabacteroides acidifaciens]MBC8600383.1 AI-2E family transporter [Parabacteroides acidifaciens]RDU51011.1 AI-2E family transporter [Parabacteroides acidifaciens]
MSLKEQYWRVSLIAIIIVLGVILFVEFIPFLGGILGASTIYILVRRQMLYLTEKKHWNRSFVAFLLLLEAVLCFLIPLSLAVWLFVSKLQNFNLDPTQLVKSIEHVASLIEQRTGYDVLDTSNLMSAVSILPKIGQTVMGSISGFAINVAVLVLILYFMLIGGAKMEKYVYSILPFSDENKKNVLSEINMIVTSNAIGIPLLAIIQGVIALIGYWIFNVPSPFLFGFLTCFATIIPVVGTALVWFPLALYMALTGDWVNALGLTAYALIVVTNVDNLIRFVLQKKMADTHPLITIFGVIIGLSLFGFMGIIFGPLLISIFILCFNIFKEKYLENAG